jgi:hypothetical protein
VSADGRGVVSHAGSRLLADLADRTTLTGELAEALGQLGRARAVHDSGRVLVDLAVAVADGAECISDIAVLADQSALFGPVASDSSVWRLLDQLGEGELAEVTGAPVPAAVVAGVELPGLVVDVDASIVVCHSEKESAATTFKSTFGYHPILAFPGQQRGVPGRAAAAGQCRREHRRGPHHRPGPGLAQIPDVHRHGVPVLVRADGAGCSKAFLAHIRGLRAQAVATEFSVGWAVTDGNATPSADCRPRHGPLRLTPRASTATAPTWPS